MIGSLPKNGEVWLKKAELKMAINCVQVFNNQKISAIVLTLYMIRHAKSSWDNPALRDFQRPLNDRGLHDAPLMAKYLKDQGVQPDLILSSPAKRALTTAQFFAAVFGIDEILQDEDIYDATPNTLMRVMSKLPVTAKVVIMFGHNPGFTEVANLFSDDFIVNIPTCGIVRIDSEAKAWNELYEGNSRLTTKYFPKIVLG